MYCVEQACCIFTELIMELMGQYDVLHYLKKKGILQADKTYFTSG
jgi:hypothetical protein